MCRRDRHCKASNRGKLSIMALRLKSDHLNVSNRKRARTADPLEWQGLAPCPYRTYLCQDDGRSNRGASMTRPTPALGVAYQSPPPGASGCLPTTVMIATIDKIFSRDFSCNAFFRGKRHFRVMSLPRCILLTLTPHKRMQRGAVSNSLVNVGLLLLGCHRHATHFCFFQLRTY